MPNSLHNEANCLQTATPDNPQDSASTRRHHRLPAIDIARGSALAAMVIYHGAWDLEFFGYLQAGTTGSGLWRIFARAIAGSFLFIAGFSLVLAHGEAIRWRGFARRLVMIMAAALLISVATYQFDPDSYVFFGILHAIAFFSVLGLCFLKAPAIVTVIIAIAVFLAPRYLDIDTYAYPFLTFTGLGSIPPRSNDFVPLFPWFSTWLAGMATAQWMGRTTIERLFAGTQPATWSPSGLLSLAGRHSLAFYLIHQPVLISAIFLASQIVAPPMAEPVAQYRMSCQRGCAGSLSALACEQFCDCTLGLLLDQNLFNAMMQGNIDIARDPRILRITEQCTDEANEVN